jgi:hypothetical protein
MNDQRKQSNSEESGAERGLGRVIYGDKEAKRTRSDKAEDAAVVTEASEESFPASDPPNYAVGNPNRVTSPETEPESDL